MLGEPKRGQGGTWYTGVPGQPGRRPFPISNTSPPLVMPQSPSSDPSALPSRASTAPPNKHAATFSRTVTSSREDRGHIPSAPTLRLQMNCAAPIFFEKRAFPTQHALCGKPCFLLTSGTNSIWHVWRDCSPFEPLPCCDYSVPPGPPSAPRPHPRQAFYWGGVRGSVHGRTGRRPPGRARPGTRCLREPAGAREQVQRDKVAGKGLATA